MYDLKCQSCGREQIDVYEPIQSPIHRCTCGGPLVRTWLTAPPNIISDECDVWVNHGICNEDGTPRHYNPKSEMRAEAKRRGLVNHVEHIGTKGGDRSKHTTRWI